MFSDSLPLENLDDLRNHVYQTLCEQNDLEIGAFEMTERILVRSGAPCGMFFCVHGPRSVKLTAVWETQSNSILFYGSNGERVEKLQLEDVFAGVSAAA